jgi:hypothetical protein
VVFNRLILNILSRFQKQKCHALMNTAWLWLKHGGKNSKDKGQYTVTYEQDIYNK